MTTVLVTFLVGGGGPATLALMTASTSTSSSFSTAASFDVVPPSVEVSVIAKTPGYVNGYIRQGGQYHVYANVTDSGSSPPSGVATVVANVSSVTTGQTSVPLVAGSFSTAGASYGWRSALLNASNPLSAGSKAYSVTATDNAGNSATRNDLAVIVDDTSPRGTDVQTANGGSTVGQPELGDTITFTFSEPIDPYSVLANWTGSATDVVVRIADGGLLASDTLTVRNAANTAQLPLGSVNLRGDYVPANRDFGASGTASSMVMSGSVITVTLGTPSGSTSTVLTSLAHMTWSPAVGATDRAGNACQTTSVDEQDLLFDVEF